MRSVTLLLVLTGVPASAWAGTFNVNNTLDVQDAAPDCICETGLGNGICTVRAAIEEANTCSGGPHTVRIPAGTYTLTDAALGSLQATADMTLVGAGRASTIRSASGLAGAGSPDRVLHTASTASVSLRDMTLRDGETVLQGGVVYAEGPLEATRVRMTEGWALIGGGVLAAEDTVAFDDLEVDNGEASLGGGVYLDGAAVMTGHGSVKHSKANVDGGGVYLESGTSILASDLVIASNEADNAGGNVYSNGGAIECTDCVFAAGDADNEGGGIRAMGGSVTLIRSEIVANLAGTLGGGLAAQGATVDVQQSSVFGNDANEGGGLYLTGGSATVLRSTIWNNVAAASGGGIAVDSGFLDVDDSTIFHNSGGIGGGIFYDATLGGSATLHGSTLADNLASAHSGGVFSVPVGAMTVGSTVISRNGAPASRDCRGTFTSAGHNHVASPGSCVGWAGLDVTGTGADIGTFIVLPTPGQSHVPPLAGGNLIGAVPSTSCSAEDQLGIARSSPCEIGAVEAP